MRRWLAWRMRFLADRIDPASGPRAPGWSFTIEPGCGMVFHDDDRAGCRLWYMAEDYDRAFPPSITSMGELADMLAEITRRQDQRAL